MQIYMKMGIKSIEWDRSNREEGQDWFKFISAAKYVVGGTNGYNESNNDDDIDIYIIICMILL